ncbi:MULTISPECIES: AAA family ATPase [Enterobacter cloacae complex]|uniref:ATPase AAA-type core domain-containing protein n=1 Tax=Enterobacter genomosp. O TaxID=2364150 RepID=A0A0X4EW25_9ENTR|nr:MULTISPECIES: AAA family ATPase [Enterobacter cloacae complex]KUQ85919.1 hypothetical protein AWI28_09800 [Enterobacter genomosp. O]MCM7110909.1 AAA family ATPase [Enterobacter cloacae]
MNKRIVSTIAKLEHKAKKGSWEAAYQLYEYYLDGKYVDKNYEVAIKYIDLAVEHIQSNFIGFDEIIIQDFRALDNLTLNLSLRNLIVLAGENGAGKSSVLDALSYSLSWLVNRILYKGGRGREIEKLDIRDNSERGYSSILTKLCLNRINKVRFELCELHLGSSANKKSYLNEVTKLGALYKFAGEHRSSFTLPIFAHYGVLRTIDINTKDINAIDDIVQINNNRFEGYINAFSGKADIKSFIKWFKRLDDIEKHRTVSTNNLSQDEDLINKLAVLAPSDVNARKLLESLMSKSKDKEEDSEVLEIYKIKQTLNHVIGEFMFGYSDLSIELQSGFSLNIKKENNKLNILQLSQGEKSLLALVLDIARRMIVLNPHLENPLHSPGVIIIDEIDLHLHPHWQRLVIRHINNIFPYCQFIVSTHSPQVISEVKHNEVVILDKDESGSIIGFSPSQSYGLTSNEILNELMSPEERQLIRNEKVEYEIKNIFMLIEEGKISEAEERIYALEDELNGSIPELVRAKMEIELDGWDKE